MDLSLPIVDGWEATRRIKAHVELKQIPIIALSAHAMTGDEEKARQSGCDDYLSKPLDEDLLFAKIDSFWQGRHGPPHPSLSQRERERSRGRRPPEEWRCPRFENSDRG